MPWSGSKYGKIIAILFYGSRTIEVSWDFTQTKMNFPWTSLKLQTSLIHENAVSAVKGYNRFMQWCKLKMPRED